MMEEEILALAQARCEQAEVYCVDVNRTLVEFRANEFHSQASRLSRGVGLRVVRNGRLGFSSTTNPDLVEETVAAALDNAAFGRLARFSFPGISAKPEVTTFDNRVIMLSALKLIDWGHELIEAVRSRVADLKLDLVFSKTYTEFVLMNSTGLDTRFSRAEFDLSATGLLVHDGLVWIPEYENLSSGRPLPVGPVCDRLEHRARLARAKKKLASGTYPVIFMPTAVPNLLLPFLAGVNGKQLEKGVSPLVGRVGQRLLDKSITIADNGLKSFGLGSGPFDGEGVPRRRNLLFDQGVFTGFLFDCATAAACRAKTTGSAGRDYATQPQPATSNIELAAGSSRLEIAMRGMREGLLVYGCIGGGQSNLLAGDVTLDVSSGYKVENGTAAGRVKDVMIAGNVYEMFSNVEALGDAQADLGNYFVPFVKFPALRVAARA
jgi:PmbA protein